MLEEDIDIVVFFVVKNVLELNHVMVREALVDLDLSLELTRLVRQNENRKWENGAHLCFCPCFDKGALQKFPLARNTSWRIHPEIAFQGSWLCHPDPGRTLGHSYLSKKATFHKGLQNRKKNCKSC